MGITAALVGVMVADLAAVLWATVFDRSCSDVVSVESVVAVDGWHCGDGSEEKADDGEEFWCVHGGIVMGLDVWIMEVGYWILEIGSWRLQEG